MTEALTASTLDALDRDGGARAGARTRHRARRPLSRPAGTCSTSSRFAAVQARILTLRGQASQVADTLDWLETTSREAGQHRHYRRRVSEQPPSPAPRSRNPTTPPPCSPRSTRPPAAAKTGNYPALLPALVRTALAIGNRQLAHQPHDRRPTPLAPTTSTPSPPPPPPSAEANDNLEAAADGYADAAQRWQRFGVVPEQAFALLGQGRCLVALGHMTEATQPSAWPATSSTSYRPPPRSPRPTRSSNRRPRSAPTRTTLRPLPRLIGRPLLASQDCISPLTV